jgi:phage shock protein C
MRKLYRVPENGVLAGICAGIAEIYHVDVTVVRLAAVFVTVMTGFAPGIITYLAGWVLAPENKEPQP